MAKGCPPGDVQEPRRVVGQHGSENPQRSRGGAWQGSGRGALTLLQRRSLIHCLRHEALRHKRRAWTLVLTSGPWTRGPPRPSPTSSGGWEAKRQEAGTDGQGGGLTSGELLSASPAPPSAGRASESSSSWMGDDGDRRVLGTEQAEDRRVSSTKPAPGAPKPGEGPAQVHQAKECVAGGPQGPHRREGSRNGKARGERRWRKDKPGASPSLEPL